MGEFGWNRRKIKGWSCSRGAAAGVAEGDVAAGAGGAAGAAEGAAVGQQRPGTASRTSRTHWKPW